MLQPPKKKGGKKGKGKKGAKAKAAITIGGVPIEEMTKEQVRIAMVTLEW